MALAVGSALRILSGEANGSPFFEDAGKGQVFGTVDGGESWREVPLLPKTGMIYALAVG